LGDELRMIYRKGTTMPVDNARMEEIFGEAVAIPAGRARAAYLDQACGGDAELRGRVEQLLAAHDATGNFLTLPEADGITGPYVPLAEGPKSRIGRYKLLEQIGEGGFGFVFMAEQEEPVRRLVALKIIKLGMDTRQVVARFEAERQALALMDHANIARVFDAGATDSGRPYFVMELVRGIPITNYCDHNNLPVHERLELVVQVCHAVQHAHQKGIIHRDLKPSNVLVTLNDGRAVPKVIDFGVAKATGQQLTEKTLFTAFAQMVGTPLYMSPEQAEMTSVDIDTRSDIYSLGVLLYELLTGTTPFDQQRMRSAAFDEIRRIIREEEPPKPSTRIGTLGESRTVTAAHRQVDAHRLSQIVAGDLDWIVMKCLEKDRTRRYETAIGLAEDIQRYLTDLPVKARRPTRIYRLKKFIRRNRLGVLAGSAIAVAVIVGLALASAGFVQAHRQAEVARVEAVRADRAAVRATAISDFLQEMLHSADPDQINGQEFTVRQLLDEISVGLSDQFATQPEVEADIQKTIGLAYRRLDTQKSEQHLRRAMELRRRLVGEQHVDFADSLVDYASALLEQMRRNETEKKVRQAIDIYRNEGMRGRRPIRALQILQIILNLQGRRSEIESIVEQAVAIANDSPDEQFPEIANIYHGLIIAKIDEAKYAEAEAMGRKCVALHLRLHRQNHPETGWGYYNFGRALLANHKYQEAIGAFQHAAKVFRQSLPPGQMANVQPLYDLGCALHFAANSDDLMKDFDSRKLDELEDLYFRMLPDKIDLSDSSYAVTNAVRDGLSVLADIHLELNKQSAAAGDAGLAERSDKKAQALRQAQREIGLRAVDQASKEAKSRAVQLLQDDSADLPILVRCVWILSTVPVADQRDANLALALASKAAQLEPSNASVVSILGVAQYRAGDWGKAVDSIEKTIAVNQGDASDEMFFLAMAHWQLGNHAEARKLHLQTVGWTDNNAPHDQQIRLLRAESAGLLGISEPALPPAAAAQP
jgi:serine/threonine protein kinase